MTQLKAIRDCRNFRKHHLAYLDDTLSGDEMATAQRHILICDSCAAHDTMVRRSLVMARNIATIEPSSAFQERLTARLAEAREERYQELRAKDMTDRHIGMMTPTTGRALWRSPRTLTALAAGAVIGTMIWRGLTPLQTPVVAMQPVIATQPVHPEIPYISPAMLQAMATGNPVFPAAIVIEEAQNQFVNVNYSMTLSDR